MEGGGLSSSPFGVERVVCSVLLAAGGDNTLEILTCCKRVETTRTFVLVVDTGKVCSTRYCRVMFLACCFLACCTNNTDLVCCLETHLGVLCRTRSWRVLGLSW